MLNSHYFAVNVQHWSEKCLGMGWKIQECLDFQADRKRRFWLEDDAAAGDVDGHSTASCNNLLTTDYFVFEASSELVRSLGT